MESCVCCRAGTSISNVPRWGRESDSGKSGAQHLVPFICEGKGERVSAQGEAWGFLLIRVKLDVLIFYPVALSIWDPSRAAELEVMVHGTLSCRAQRHRHRGQVLTLDSC